MLFLVVLVIALGWAGWLWAWGRDRLMSNRGFGVAPGSFAGRPPSAFGAPRTASMARKRRRDVLFALGACAFVSLLLALGGSLVLWLLHLAIDVLFVSYGWAVYNIEQGQRGNAHAAQPLSPLRTVPRMSLQPIVDDGVGATRPGPLRQSVASS